MRKMLITIGILAIIFVGMIIYNRVRVDNVNTVSVEEIQNVEDSITKVYLWREITGEAIPTFDNINEANDTWVWEAVKNNLENYEVTYEEIDGKAKEIFGEEFNKEFPKEGNSSFTYDEANNIYIATEVELDQEEDSFLLDNINKTNDGYEVEITEYLEDYSDENSIIIKTTNDEEIGRVAVDDSETKIQEIVKNNIDRFTKKKVYIKSENNTLVIVKVERM